MATVYSMPHRLLLCGDEHMAMELRLRTLIELACNKQYYLSKELASVFTSFANYDESVIDCAKVSGYSSIWTMWALSFVLERDIISLYPAANGSGDLANQNLNVTFTPRLKDVENEVMYIMWSRVNPQQDKNSGPQIVLFQSSFWSLR